MPTNLPPEAKDRWAKVEATNDPKLKLKAYEDFLAAVPQHKGTMKLRGQIKKKMAIIRRDLDDKKKKGTGKSSGGPKIYVEKDGAAQIAVLGMTNVGKSSLLASLTNAKVEVSPVPYTSHEPVPSIMNYKDIRFQLVEAPAMIEGSADGKLFGMATIGSARSADGVILMIDLSVDPIMQLDLLLEELEKSRVMLSKPKGHIDIDRKHSIMTLRIILVGKLIDCTMKDVENLLRSYKINDAIVKISGEVTLDEVEDAIFESTIYKPALIIANKLDCPGAQANLKLLQSRVANKNPIIAISAEKKIGLDQVGEALFKTMDIIRIYTKEPGSKLPSTNPFTLKKGATIQELAKNIHGDFLKNFAFARVWAKRLPFSPQKAGLTFVLDDGDIVEMHTK